MTATSGATLNDVIITVAHLMVAAFGIWAGMKTREHELKKRRRREKEQDNDA